MRGFSEPTCRNLLCFPLVLGVPFFPLLLLAVLVVVIQITGQNSALTSALSMSVAFVGFLSLRVLNRFLKPGWEESILFWFEERLSHKKGSPGEFEIARPFAVTAPDTLDERGLIMAQAPLKNSHGVSAQAKLSACMGPKLKTELFLNRSSSKVIVKILETLQA